MKRWVLVLPLLFSTAHAQSAPQEISNDELTNTLRCESAYAKSASKAYDIFPGALTLIHVADNYGDKKTNPDFSLILTDGNQVYSVRESAPQNAWGPHDLKIEIPSQNGTKKLYCLQFEAAAVGMDQVKLFQPSPPAVCNGFKKRSAQSLQGREAHEALQKIQGKIGLDVRLQTRLAQRLLEHPGSGSVESRKVIDRLVNFDPQACQGLAGLQNELQAVENFRRAATKQRGLPLPAAPSAKGTD